MDELWARIGLIVGALGVAYAVTVILRARAAGSPISLEATGLAEGVYFFSSSACPDCRQARARLEDGLGESGFTELRWEESPGVFHELGVAAVPATLLVDADGSGTLYPGHPDKALVRLGP